MFRCMCNARNAPRYANTRGKAENKRKTTRTKTNGNTKETGSKKEPHATVAASGARKRPPAGCLGSAVAICAQRLGAGDAPSTVHS